VRYLGMHMDPPGGAAGLGGHAGLGGLADMTLQSLGLVTGHVPSANDPAFHGSAAALVTVRPTMPGRGFRSSISQLNLSRLCHCNHQICPT